MATFYAITGDANKLISTQLSDELGPKDVTGATITFHARNRVDPTITISGAGAIVTAASGIISYTLTGANLTTPTVPGEYDVDWQIVVGGATITWPDPGFDTLIIQQQVG